MANATKVTAWEDRNGVLHRSIEAWQIAEMLAVLNETDGSGMIDAKHLEMLAVDLIGTQSDAVIAILTTGPRSRPGARKKPGTTAPKRAVRKATPAEAKQGFKAMRNAANGIDPSSAAGTDVPAEPEIVPQTQLI